MCYGVSDKGRPWPGAGIQLIYVPVAEQSSSVLIIAIAVLILLMLLATVHWARRTDPTPKPPLHSFAVRATDQA